MTITYTVSSEGTTSSCCRHDRPDNPVATMASAMGREPRARGIRALWRRVANPLLLSVCLAVAALMAIQAGLGTSQAAPPGAGLIAEIQLLRSAVHVGDTVQLAAAEVIDSRLTSRGGC
jgi:hypothetical protein